MFFKKFQILTKKPRFSLWCNVIQESPKVCLENQEFSLDAMKLKKFQDADKKTGVLRSDAMSIKKVHVLAEEPRFLLWCNVIQGTPRPGRKDEDLSRDE